MKRTLIVLIALMMLLPMGQIAGATQRYDCIHDLVEVIEKTEPTCNSAGMYRFRCLECGFEDYYVTPSIPHDYEDVKVYEKATCVSQGDAAVRCKMCDQRTRIWKPIDPNAHEWREVSKTPSTCTTSGNGSYICNLCGKTEERKLPKGSHSYGSWTIIREAGDFTMGQRSCKCKLCGYMATEDYYPEGTMYRGGVNDVEAVTKLQNQMTDLGYDLGEIDGVYGRQTKQAVTEFQTEVGMPVPADGIGWPKTVAMIDEAWKARMGVGQETAAQPTAAPTAEPTAEPTVKPTMAPPIIFEVEVPYCKVSEDTGETVYCAEHQALVDVDKLLTGSARDDAGRIKALNQVGSLWQAELDTLNGKWMAAAAEDEKEAVSAGVDAFSNYLAAQRMLWKQQYKNNEAAALEKANQMLTEQCAVVCAIVYELSQETVYTEKGYVSVSLTNGWYVGASMAKDSLTLHNASIGAEKDCWLTITDGQNIDSVEIAKQIARFSFPDGEFIVVVVGENPFYYIANEQKTMFSMIAETSTGKTVKIDGKNCTLEQIIPLLETMVIR